MKAKKSYGQHFLIDRSVIGKMIRAAQIEDHDRVLEIGPGTGAITRALLEAGADVHAIEADRDLIAALHASFPALHLIAGDAVKIHQSADASSSDFPLVDLSYTLVANLPYNIASRVLREYLSRPPRPRRLIVMVQREVADRIVAKPPDMGVLSVACQLYAECKKIINVKPSSFRPKPKVDSAIVQLDLYPSLRAVVDREAKQSLSRRRLLQSTDDSFAMTDTEAEEIISLAKTGFSSRRKQLHRNLADKGIASSDTIKGALKELGLPETARAQELSVEQWKEVRGLIGEMSS